MQSGVLLKWCFFIVSIFGVTFSSLVIIFLLLDVPIENVHAESAPSVRGLVSQNLIAGDSIKVTESSSSPEQATPGLPARLKIPKINVDAAIEDVGLTADGAVGTPKDFTDVAWYNLGPRPGENGNAIFSGHYGWKNNQASVFDGLYKLRLGDEIYIEDDNGATVTFVVRALRRYNSDKGASDVFASNDGKSHLNLITCEGDWNKVTQSYPTRLVVFADKEISQ